MTSQLPGSGNFSPPDPDRSVYDDQDNVQEALEGAGIPDYLASILAEVACRGWDAERDGADLMRDLRRHLEPVIDEAEQRAIADADMDAAEAAWEAMEDRAA